jgi:peptide/nickel transport system substrate-binding protein
MLLLAILGLALLSAAAHAQPHDTITIGMSQFPPDMHPFITSTSVRNVVLQAMNRPMVATNTDGSLRCVLCAELPSLENGQAALTARADGSRGMRVTYTLKPDLFWADGTRLTARDIAFSFKVNATFNPPQYIEAVTADDDLHVTVALRSPVYDYQRIGSIFVLPEHIEGPIFSAAKDPLDYGRRSAFNRQPENPGLWFGPYHVAEFAPNDHIVMVPNPYWKGTTPAFRRVTLRLIENTAALQANLLSGDVDTVATSNMGLTLDQTLALSKNQAARFDFDFWPAAGSYEQLKLNLDNTLLADKRVRHAISMAIDRKTIVARLFENRFSPAILFLHPSEPGFDPGVKGWPYDPAAARAVLAEAGFKPGADGVLVRADGTRFSIDLVSTAGNRTRELVGQVLQTQLKAVGIALVIKNEPARVMFGETLRKRSFNGMVEFEGGAGVDALPMDMLSSHYIPGPDNAWSGRNYGGFRNAAMDAALADARAELDPVRRKQLWKRILEIYADEMPDIPLYFAATAVITPKWLAGLNDPGRLGFFTAWIENWRPK